MLTRDELIDAIGAIDADLVEDFVRTDERLQKKKGRRVSPLMRAVALAACFALILASVPVMARRWREGPTPELPMPEEPTDKPLSPPTDISDPNYNRLGFSCLDELCTFVYGSQAEQLSWLRKKYDVGHPSDNYADYTYDDAKRTYDFTKRIIKQPMPIIYYNEPVRSVTLNVYYGSLDQHFVVQYQTFGFSVFYPSEACVSYIQNGDLEGYYKAAHSNYVFVRDPKKAKKDYLTIEKIKLNRTDMDSEAIIFVPKNAAPYIEFIRDGLIFRIYSFQNYGEWNQEELIRLANELIISDITHPREDGEVNLEYQDVLKQQLDEQTYLLLTDRSLYDSTMNRVDLTKKPILKIYHNVFWEYDGKALAELQELAEQEGKVLHAVFDKEIYLLDIDTTNGKTRIEKRRFEYSAPRYLSNITRCETVCISNDGEVQSLREIICFDSIDNGYGATVYYVYSNDVWVKYYPSSVDSALVMRQEQFERLLKKYREIRKKYDSSFHDDKGKLTFRDYYFNEEEYDLKYAATSEETNIDKAPAPDRTYVYWIVPAVVLSGVGVVFVIWKKKRHQKK